MSNLWARLASSFLPLLVSRPKCWPWGHWPELDHEAKACDTGFSHGFDLLALTSKLKFLPRLASAWPLLMPMKCYRYFMSFSHIFVGLPFAYRVYFPFNIAIALFDFNPLIVWSANVISLLWNLFKLHLCYCRVRAYSKEIVILKKKTIVLPVATTTTMTSTEYLHVSTTSLLPLLYASNWRRPGQQMGQLPQLSSNWILRSSQTRWEKLRGGMGLST